jgi:RNA polymerase sigma factor (sigma-70 family)
MATSVLDHIRRTVLCDRADVGDGDLLGRFIERRDEAALAALVKRHGPMVWGVCRRLLNHQDAEDVFQATFIVLIRKAASVVPREMVGNWLYGVAHLAALQARRTIARRRVREVQVTEMPDTTAAQNDQGPDALLDWELSRLPDRYRVTIILCDLEGKTRKEAARHLGLPEGTVGSRLARARAMLAKRLTQRGVAFSGGTLAAALSQRAVPAAVISSTIKAASHCAAGQAALTVNVAALAEGVLRTMLLMKVKSAMAVLVVAAMVGLFGYGVAMGQQNGDPVALKKQESDKKDGVVKEKVEMKDITAWGKEVDGLQAGLALVPADASTIRQGEKLKLAVKLRNVGRADIKITHGLLREYRPEVTTDTGGRVSVYMPPSFRGYAVQTKRTLKPGETITLYNPEVAVESEDRAKMLGEMRVETPTITVASGKYKIAFGGMIQSHPKLATGTVGFEVKDQVAWGKEMGGLQAGIVGPGTVRIGEKARFTVKLRNVGKETIKVSVWPLWTCYPGVVDSRGKRVPTTTAPSPLFEIIPESLALKSGETVDAGCSDLLVAEPDQKVTVPDGVVDLCAIHVAPGKYTAGCIGFLKENQTLATATVEFEVKHVSVTAWGKEVGGLQAGLSIDEKRAYHTGETVTLDVRVRNVGKEEVTFQYLRQFLMENAPTVVDGGGKPLQFRYGVRDTAIYHVPVDLNLAPGKETVLGEVELPTSLMGTGKFTLQYERVFGNSSAGRVTPDPTLSKLATGKLELEVAPEKR